MALDSSAELPCPNCSAPLVEIALPGGTSLMHMRSCSRCHSRFWWRDGVPVDLPTALTTMARCRSSRRGRRSEA